MRVRLTRSMSSCAVALALAGCSGGGATIGPAPATLAPNATPTPAANATPAPGVSTTPAPGSSATPVPGASATPAPGSSATPAPGMTGTPSPGATATPKPGMTATPAPGATPTPTPGATATPAPGATATPVAMNANGTPQLRHVFVIVLENQAEDNTFGVKMPVPYLQNTVSSQGAFIPNYWGTSHNSLGNYVTLLSGQSVTQINQQDCPTYIQIANPTAGNYGQVAGQGCVYPASTANLADQLKSAKYTYKGYMEDMGLDTTREGSTCGQTQPTATTGVYGSPDQTLFAQAGNAVRPTDQYAQRHNPFVYFTSVISSGDCAKYVGPLTDNTLTKDLQSIATTPNFSFITPNLCNDGHDVPCAAPGAAGNINADFSNENSFLQKWVPLITRSPAFVQDGLLIITFDESSPAHNTNVGTDTSVDSTSCCMEPIEVDPNTGTPGNPPGSSNTADGTGGGKTGAVLISPFIAPGTVSAMSYNHFATLAGIEDEFGLTHIGYAAFPGTRPFGSDIFGPTPTRHTISL